MPLINPSLPAYLTHPALHPHAHINPSLPPTDWRVVVSAPLRITNQLPVGGSLLVWELQPGAGRELVGRQTVQVASGATVPIHTGVAGTDWGRVAAVARGLQACAPCAVGPLVLVHAGTVLTAIVRGCSSVPFHAGRSSAPSGSPIAADMRQAVSFTFYPEGYEWVEPQPTVLSEGHAGGCREK